MADKIAYVFIVTQNLSQSWVGAHPSLIRRTFCSHRVVLLFQLLEKTSMQVIPGRDTDLKIAVEARRRLEPPWGDCVDLDFLQYARFGHGDKVVYTYDACMDECYEMRLRESCGCKDVHSMGLMASQYQKVPYCGDIKMGYDWLVLNMSCMSLVRNDFVELCRERCGNSCRQVTFDVTSSAAQWPEPLEALPFYRSHINNTAIEQTFLDEFYSGNKSNFNENNDKDLDQLFYFIRQRFTKVRIFFPSDTYREFEDHKKASSSQLMSQVGAILNFWAGITVLLFVEVADCFLKICHQLTQRTPSSQDTEFSETSKGRDSSQKRAQIHVSQISS